MARLLFHDWNTAPMAARNCCRGSSGKSVFASRRTISRYRSISFCSAAGVRSASVAAPVLRLISSRASSNRCPSTPSTILLNSWMKRRWASRAKRRSFVSAAKPSSVDAFRPRFSTVSIIPGIENFAPLRTLTSSGFFGSPNRLPVCFSTWRSAASICSSMPRGNFRALA